MSIDSTAYLVWGAVTSPPDDNPFKFPDWTTPPFTPDGWEEVCEDPYVFCEKRYPLLDIVANGDGVGCGTLGHHICVKRLKFDAQNGIITKIPGNINSPTLVEFEELTAFIKEIQDFNPGLEFSEIGWWLLCNEC